MPFMKQMEMIKDKQTAELATFNYRMYGNFNKERNLTEEEARDNFFKEQIIEEQYK